MTEQERYTIEKDLVTEKLYIWDYDDPICEIDDDKTLTTVVNLLNKLNEENEQLKHELLCKQLDKAPTEPINCKCYYKELQE